MRYRFRDPADARLDRASPMQRHRMQWASDGAEMKIYLLLMLMGALLTAIRMTSLPESRSETLPQ